MENLYIILIITGFGLFIFGIILIFFGLKKHSDKSFNNINDTSLVSLQETILSQINENSKMLRTEVGDAIAKSRMEQAEAINAFRNEMKMDADKQRQLLEEKLRTLQEDNNKQLDKMRQTVDEILQETLERRINEKFKCVSDQLEQVHKGLGEMQTLASDVGGLKNILSNVKQRGIFGEIQLKFIIEEIFSNEQYVENFATKIGSNDRVEFALKLPGDDNNHIYLPIDAKFPMDAYNNLRDAAEEGDKGKTDQAGKLLDSAIKKAAKDISEKYIDVPNTTDFAIMFLPAESLYAEVVNRGMIEILQRDYKVNIAGPTTLAALLNSLQMGFRTLAIQKRSSEVWQVLEAVKKAFADFGGVLESYQKKMNTAQGELDKLVGVRTRAINSKLRNIQSATDMMTASKILELDADNEPGILLEGDIIDEEDVNAI
jgi:DNA recombination protein RmuC